MARSEDAPGGFHGGDVPVSESAAGTATPMVRAYIFISTEKARSGDVAAAIRTLPYVSTAHVITGQFDVIALVEAPELGMLWIMVDKFQDVPGVTKTTTNLVVEK